MDLSIRRNNSRTLVDYGISNTKLPVQSNGKVENAAKSAKRIMQKAKKSNSDPFIALLNFRNTPQQVTDYSPVQQLINRRTRTLLPMKSSLLKSNIPENVQENIQRSKEKQAKYYNRNARFLQELNRGDTVRIAPQQGNKEWEKGVVKNKHSERSYEVQKENGRFIRRNRKYLRKTKEQFNPYNAPEDTNIKPNDTSENMNIETNHKQTTTEDETPKYSRYGRQLTKPSWMKDFVTT